jgi:hypothetical protein
MYSIYSLLKKRDQLHTSVRLVHYIPVFNDYNDCSWKNICELPTHALCDCEAVTYLRFHHLDHYVMEPGNYHDVIRKVLRIIRCVVLITGWIRRGSTISLEGCSARAGWILAHPLHIHTSHDSSICPFVDTSGISCIYDISMWSFRTGNENMHSS